MRARVVSASVSSCRLLLDGQVVSAVLKGKVLKGVSFGDTSPLVAGDEVEVVSDGGRFLISARLKRKSAFSRYNFLKKKNQVIGVNFDMICPVVSHLNPEMNEYFANTVLAGFSGDAGILFIASKADLPFSDEDNDSFGILSSAGFDILKVSSVTGVGINELKRRITGMTVLFAGESGSGKSSLLNRLFGRQLQSVGELSAKNNKGSHTTSSSVLYACDDFSCIDTPGVRYVLPLLSDGVDIPVLFPEFLDCQCRFSDCGHISETGCAVRSAVEKGRISDRRYSYYLKLVESAARIPKYVRESKSFESK